MLKCVTIINVTQINHDNYLPLIIAYLFQSPSRIFFLAACQTPIDSCRQMILMFLFILLISEVEEEVVCWLYMARSC